MGRLTIIVAVTASVFSLLGLLLFNSYFFQPDKPEYGVLSSGKATTGQENITLMAYNIRWCQSGSHCLDDVAALVAEHRADIVFVAAIYAECMVCPAGNQVEYLARETGMNYYAFSENYRLGIPFFQYRSGVAILSRYPFASLVRQSLPSEGRDPRLRRSALWAQVELGGQRVALASLHNSYGDQSVNMQQFEHLLSAAGSLPLILGGDFNTRSGSASMQYLRDSGRFVGDIDGPDTYPASNPDRRLDYILVPAGWTPLHYQVISSPLSAHLPVVSTFAIEN